MRVGSKERVFVCNVQLLSAQDCGPAPGLPRAELRLRLLGWAQDVCPLLDDMGMRSAQVLPGQGWGKVPEEGPGRRTNHVSVMGTIAFPSNMLNLENSAVFMSSAFCESGLVPGKACPGWAGSHQPRGFAE